MASRSTNGSTAIVGERALAPERRRVVGRLVEVIRHAALEDSSIGVETLTVNGPTPAASISHNRLIGAATR